MEIWVLEIRISIIEASKQDDCILSDMQNFVEQAWKERTRPPDNSRPRRGSVLSKIL